MTDANEPTLRVLGIAGSLREASFNRALLRAATEVAPPPIAIEVFELNPIPMFNQDLEAEGDPLSVQHLKGAIRASDALLISTPEYNGGIPGVLKNALDWASRKDEGQPASLAGMPVGIMGASPGRFGTVRSQLHLRQVLRSAGATTLPRPDVFVDRVSEKVDADGELTDEDTRQRVSTLLQRLADWVERNRS